MKTRNSSSTVYRPCSHIRKMSDGGSWLEGVVATWWGYVVVYSQGDDQNRQHTSLRFIWGEREWYRSMNKTFSKRGLATVATRFAREIVNQESAQ